MFKNKQKGFTLIELLVVIAIIGLLAGIVLVSLGGARDRARDARIQAAIAQVKPIAELVYNQANAFSYAAICDPLGPPVNSLNQANATFGTQLGVLETEMDTQNGGLGAEPLCFANATDYCVSVVLATGTTFCISEVGSTGTIACAAAGTNCI